MYPEPRRDQVFVGSMNMGYISDTAMQGSNSQPVLSQAGADPTIPQWRTTTRVELIIHRPRTKLENSKSHPTDGVTRLTNIKILGVIVTDTLSFDMHIDSVML